MIPGLCGICYAIADAHLQDGCLAVDPGRLGSCGDLDRFHNSRGCRATSVTNSVTGTLCYFSLAQRILTEATPRTRLPGSFHVERVFAARRLSVGSENLCDHCVDVVFRWLPVANGAHDSVAVDEVADRHESAVICVPRNIVRVH